MVASAVITTFTEVVPVLNIVMGGIVDEVPEVGVTPVKPFAFALHEYVTPLTPLERSICCVVSPEQIVWLMGVKLTVATGCMVMVVSTGEPGQPFALGVIV